MEITEKNKNIKLVSNFCKKNNIENIGIIDFKHKLFYAKYEDFDVIKNSLKEILINLKKGENGY